MKRKIIVGMLLSFCVLMTACMYEEDNPKLPISIGVQSANENKEELNLQNKDELMVQSETEKIVQNETEIQNEMESVHSDESNINEEYSCESESAEQEQSVVEAEEPTAEMEGTIVEEEIETVNLVDMKPFVGKTDDFWYGGTVEDNLGNEYDYHIYCGAESYSEEITYALDGKYVTLTADFGLRDADNDIKKYIWIEFYGDGKKIGQTTKFTAGVRPCSLELDVSGVNDLKIVTNADSIHQSGFLVTNGIFVSTK
ncbi:MAG: NPCBM/NEW2 domain-containing protein [Lachnospiraceae bacterium]